MTVPGPAVLDIPAAVDAALALRRELDVRVEDPLPCVLRLAEDLAGLDVVVAPLPAGVSGFYLPRAKRGLIAVNGTHAVVRQRFTIAHELGHHVLGHGAAPRVVAIAETPTAVEVRPDAEPASGDDRDGVDTAARGEAGASIGGAAPSGEAGRSIGGAAPSGEAGASIGAAAPSGEAGTSADTVTSGLVGDPRADAAAAAPASVPETPRKPTEPRERAANAFAAELLCPAPAARAFVGHDAPAGSDGEPTIDFDLVVRLSCAFGLSAWAVVMRLGTAEVLANGPVRRALQQRVDDAEHLPRYAELGLTALQDELEQVAAIGLPRLPEGINGEFLLAVVDPHRSPDELPAPMRELRRMLGLDGGVV